jgi:hypothetical protein
MLMRLQMLTSAGGRTEHIWRSIGYENDKRHGETVANLARPSHRRPIDAIPGPLPSNTRLASYLPFEWVLPTVDVLVTNGGYGSVNQAMSFGIPPVTAGLTEDKAGVNARLAWSGIGIDLATNEPTPQALREAVRTVLDKPNYRLRASLMAEEFDAIDTRSEILRIVSQVSHISDEDDLRRSAVTQNKSTQAHLNANHLAPID